MSLTDQKTVCSTFKLVIVGDGGVGKTTFVKRHCSGESGRTRGNMGCEVHPLDFNTNYGKVCFKCWDTAGQEESGNIRDEYYTNGQGAIIMFDVTNMHSYENVAKWYRDLCRFYGKEMIPVVLCGNKVDLKNKRQVKPKQIQFHRMKNLPYFEISAKANYNFEKPFLHLARMLLKNRDLIFEELPTLAKQLVQFDKEAQIAFEAELDD